MKDKRRVVSLPRKEDMIFSSNYSKPDKRFQSLLRKFQENAEFRDVYYTQMTSYIEKGQVEQATAAESRK